MTIANDQGTRTALPYRLQRTLLRPLLLAAVAVLALQPACAQVGAAPAMPGAPGTPGMPGPAGGLDLQRYKLDGRLRVNAPGVGSPFANKWMKDKCVGGLCGAPIMPNATPTESAFTRCLKRLGSLGHQVAAAAALCTALR